MSKKIKILVVIIVGLTFAIAGSCEALLFPSEFENYTTGYVSGRKIGDYRWTAQSFTPDISHPVSAVKIYAHRGGALPTNVPVIASIYEFDLDTHTQTGDELATGDINSFDISYGEGTKGWYEIPLDTEYDLIAGTNYVLIIKSPTGDYDDNYVYWYYNSPADYKGTDNQYMISTDSGASWFWSDYTIVDTMFQEYGSPLTSMLTASVEFINDIWSDIGVFIYLGIGVRVGFDFIGRLISIIKRR